jgi:hypothetical protein
MNIIIVQIENEEVFSINYSHFQNYRTTHKEESCKAEILVERVSCMKDELLKFL